MGYIIEIDDLRKRIEYPPRGMEFEPVATEVAAVEEIPADMEPKPLWEQRELNFQT